MTLTDNHYIVFQSILTAENNFCYQSYEQTFGTAQQVNHTDYGLFSHEGYYLFGIAHPFLTECFVVENYPELMMGIKGLDQPQIYKKPSLTGDHYRCFYIVFIYHDILLVC